MSAPPASRYLALCRRYRTFGVWVFFALLLLASAERRLADFDFNNSRAAGTGFERCDVDGDEIRDRLKACNDEKVPAPPDGHEAIALGASPPSTPRLDSASLGSLPPRGPPASVSSAA